MIYWLRWFQAVCWAAMHDPDFQHRGLAGLFWPIEWSGSISDEYWGRTQSVWLLQGYLTVRWPILWIRSISELPSSPQGYCPDSAYDEVPF